MSVRIQVGERRFTTNLHDAAVLVERGQAKATTDADAKAIAAYAAQHAIPKGKAVAEKKKKIVDRRAAVRGMRDWAKSEQSDMKSAQKEKR